MWWRTHICVHQTVNITPYSRQWADWQGDFFAVYHWPTFFFFFGLTPLISRVSASSLLEIIPTLSVSIACIVTRYDIFTKANQQIVYFPMSPKE